MKIFISTASFSGKNSPAIRLLEKNKITYDVNKLGRKLRESEIKKIIDNYDGVIAGTEKYSKSLLNKCRNLKIIARVGTGIDAIDIKTATKNKIAVTNTPVAPVSAVCELSVALILSLTRGYTYCKYKFT